MDARLLKLVVPVALAALLLGALVAHLLRPVAAPAEPDAETIAAAALLSVREQGRVATFAARFVAIVSTSEERFGLTARKTLIMPGTVRYGINLARIRREHMAWDSVTGTLSVTLPPLEIAGPRIDLNEVREHAEGGILMAITDAEETIDQANRRRAQEELMRQAREPRPLGEAREAAMRLVARSFAMPLRAAGIDASVAVRFVDAAGREEAAYLDRRHRIEDAVKARD